MRKVCCHRHQWARLRCNYFNLSFNDRCVRILETIRCLYDSIRRVYTANVRWKSVPLMRIQQRHWALINSFDMAIICKSLTFSYRKTEENRKNMVNHTNNQCLIDIVHISTSFKIRTHYIDWKHTVITDNTTFVEFIAYSHSTSTTCTAVLQHCKQSKRKYSIESQILVWQKNAAVEIRKIDSFLIILFEKTISINHSNDIFP